MFTHCLVLLNFLLVSSFFGPPRPTGVIELGGGVEATSKVCVLSVKIVPPGCTDFAYGDDFCTACAETNGSENCQGMTVNIPGYPCNGMTLIANSCKCAKCPRPGWHVHRPAVPAENETQQAVQIFALVLDQTESAQPAAQDLLGEIDHFYGIVGNVKVGEEFKVLLAQTRAGNDIGLETIEHFVTAFNSGRPDMADQLASKMSVVNRDIFGPQELAPDWPYGTMLERKAIVNNLAVLAVQLKKEGDPFAKEVFRAAIRLSAMEHIYHRDGRVGSLVSSKKYVSLLEPGERDKILSFITIPTREQNDKYTADFSAVVEAVQKEMTSGVVSDVDGTLVKAWPSVYDDFSRLQLVHFAWRALNVRASRGQSTDSLVALLDGWAKGSTGMTLAWINEAKTVRSNDPKKLTSVEWQIVASREELKKRFNHRD